LKVPHDPWKGYGGSDEVQRPTPSTCARAAQLAGAAYIHDAAITNVASIHRRIERY